MKAMQISFIFIDKLRIMKQHDFHWSEKKTVKENFCVLLCKDNIKKAAQ